MATINYLLKSKKEFASIYIRIIDSKKIDFSIPTGININYKFWDNKTQKIRNVIDVANREEINSNLDKLKIYLKDAMNLGYMKGEIISKFWIESKIKLYFNRPKLEKSKLNTNHMVYVSDFAEYWLKNIAPTWKVSSSKMLDQKTILHYRILNNLFKDFEGKDKILLRNINNETMDLFSLFLTESLYSEITIKRMIGRLKFFCARAEQMNFEVNKNYKQIVFVKKQVIDYKSPYLNENEINAIFNYDFSYNENLDNARDNFIIGLRTGLRISDYNNQLDISNFKNGFIEIVTTKTKTKVAIPIHNQINTILQKRKGNLPGKISDQKFNCYIKNICQILEFDNLMIGGVIKVDPITKIKRKEIKEYKKYELVTSHIARRSFVTNHFGKVPNKVLMDICGWKSENQMINYNKSTSLDSAKILQEYWKKN